MTCAHMLHVDKETSPPLHCMYIPLQIFPSKANWYPSTHEHSKLPIVLLHCWLHPEVPSAHSSISAFLIYELDDDNLISQWNLYLGIVHTNA